MISGKVIVLDIGHRYIHLAEGKTNKKQIEVSKYAQVDTPDGCFKEGAITDSASLATAISAAVRIIVRDFVLPVVKAEEYRTMVELEMEQYVPNLVTDFALGFVMQPDALAEADGQARVKAYAMPKLLVADYNNLAKSAGLKPQAIDVQFNASEKLIKSNFFKNGSPQAGEDNVMAFIDFGHTFTSLNIFAAGGSVYNRLIQTGSGSLWSDIAVDQEISIDGFQKHLSSHVTKLLAEIQTNIQFFVGRNQENRPKIFYIYGGFSKLSGLADQISKTFNVPVVYLNQLSSFTDKAAQAGQQADYVQFVNVLGGFIRKE